MKHNLQLLKTIIVLAAPAIIEMSLNTALMVADTIMVSRFISPAALSAVGIANSIMFTIIFVFSSFNIGAVALISRSIGEGDREKARRYAQTNIALNFMIGIVVSVAVLLLKPLLFSPYMITDQVKNFLHSYYDIVAYGMVFQFMSFAFASISRGAGDTKTPMFITGSSVIVNIVLNYLLILGVYGFPQLGIAGAALATTIARLIGFVIYVVLFFSGHHQLKLKLTNIKIYRPLLSSLWKISYPGAVEQFLMQSSFFLLGIIVATLPTDSEAVFRIVLNIESTSFMPAVGISVAAATLVGNALGEGDEDKAHAIGKLSGVLALSWGLCIGAIFFVMPQHIIAVFTDDLQLVQLGIPVLIVIGFNQPLLNYTITMSGALRGAGDTSFVMKLTTLRLWTIFIPGSVFAIIMLNQGVVGLWYAEIVSLLVFSSVLFLRFRSRKWADLRL